jgi:integrase
MRWEYINWDSAFYFNPKGKTRKARRPVPLSDRVIALLRIIQHEQFGRADGWVFPSKKSRSGHIELSGIEHVFRKIARELGIPDALKLYCARPSHLWYGRDGRDEESGTGQGSHGPRES